MTLFFFFNLFITRPPWVLHSLHLFSTSPASLSDGETHYIQGLDRSGGDARWRGSMPAPSISAYSGFITCGKSFGSDQLPGKRHIWASRFRVHQQIEMLDPRLQNSDEAERTVPAGAHFVFPSLQGCSFLRVHSYQDKQTIMPSPWKPARVNTSEIESVLRSVSTQ